MTTTVETCEDRRDWRFPIQQQDRKRWLLVTAANAVIDYVSGYEEVVNSFVESRTEFEYLSTLLQSLSPADLRGFADSSQSRSLDFLVMMLTGECNANCDICFTDRKKKPGELTAEERRRILREAKELGARYVYVPGEGEPTIDRGFRDFVETIAELGLEAIVFTNGLVFSDERACRRYFQMSIDDTFEWLSGMPVSWYSKYWTADQSLLSVMMRINAEKYHFQSIDGVGIPRGLALMMDSLPRERVGIEVVIEQRNAEEALESIIPFAREHGISQIVEVVQHNGRLFGDGRYDPSESQLASIQSLLSPTSCTAATTKAVVTSRGVLSPRIAVLEDQVPGEPVSVRDGSLYSLLHGTDYLVELRYQLSCLCEEIPVALANGSTADFVGPESIVPPALDASLTGSLCGGGGGGCGGCSIGSCSSH